jgi:hypothetical protein
VTPSIWLPIFGLLLAGFVDAGKVQLKPATTQEFDQYIRTTEAKLDQQINSPAFLWVDGDPARKQRVQRGEVLAEPVVAKGDVEVTDGLVHDWVGAAFVPGGNVEKMIAMFEDYDNAKNIYKPEVVDSKLLEHSGNNYKVYMRLLKKQVITVVLNTTHEVRYVPVDRTHWYSRSYSSRIAEVQDPGKPSERELPPGQDHGFLWRLNSYWRFVERDGGVYVECQAVSLTRNVPTGLGWLINPIIRSLPRQSLENTLRSAQKASLKLR